MSEVQKSGPETDKESLLESLKTRLPGLDSARQQKLEECSANTLSGLVPNIDKAIADGKTALAGVSAGAFGAIKRALSGN